MPFPFFGGRLGVAVHVLTHNAHGSSMLGRITHCRQQSNRLTWLLALIPKLAFAAASTSLTRMLCGILSAHHCTAQL